MQHRKDDSTENQYVISKRNYILKWYLYYVTMIDSSPSAPSPNRNAKSQTLWVALSTLSFSSYVNLWFCINYFISKLVSYRLKFLSFTWAATRACSIIVLASAVIPLTAQPKCSSISIIFSIELASNKVEETRFSTAKTTPSEVWTPMAVVPSYV